MSDRQYDTEFWFNATLYTAYEWHGGFDTEAETREAFDAWLNSIRAEAWEEGYSSGLRDMDKARAGGLQFRDIATNPHLSGETT